MIIVRAMARRRMFLSYTTSPRLLARIRRQLVIFGAVFLGLGVALYVLSGVFLAQPHTLDTLEYAMLAAWIGTICLAAAPYYYAIYPQALQMVGAHLREHLSGRTIGAYPPIPNQPVPLAAHETPAQPQKINHLAGLMDGVWKWGLWPRAILLLVYAVIIAFFAIICAFAASAPTASGTVSSATDVAKIMFTSAAIALGIIALMCLLSGAMGLRRAILLMHGQTVLADAQGLRWKDARYRTGKHALAWGEITGFCLAWLDGTISDQTGWAYLIIGAHDILVWTVPLYPSPQALAASDRLVRLVVTRTGLPLRDISGLVDAYTQAASALSALSPRRRVEDLRKAGVMLPPDALTDAALRRATWKWRRVWIGAGMVILLFVLWLAVALAI